MIKRISDFNHLIHLKHKDTKEQYEADGELPHRELLTRNLQGLKKVLTGSDADSSGRRKDSKCKTLEVDGFTSVCEALIAQLEVHRLVPFCSQ